jgi:single-stranded-DNA-specific exonuclease
MNYKLIDNSLNDIYNPKETVLRNRGIEDVNTYLNLDDSVLIHYSELDNIREAVECLLKHLENDSEVHILVDPDTDGQTSASEMYRYLKLIKPNVKLTYSIHTTKQHGLSYDIKIPEETNLLIIPDAGSNDVNECKNLKEKGIDIIILDHHEMNTDLQPIGDGMIINYNPYAIIVNPQNCNYLNKAISGCAVVYKFLQALDEETWNDYADNFLDLVALGLIGDSMNIKEPETKRLIDKGLSKIRSKLFKALIDKQSYSMNNILNINNVQWYIVPLINGLIRAGDYDEKDLLFRAFIETDEVFKYKPRRKSKDDPEPEEIDEDIYTRVARLCGNARQRQNNTKNKDVEKILGYIEEKGHHNNKIVIVNVTDKLNESLTGLVAMNIASKYHKPCLLLRKVKNKPDYYGGSARNINRSPIKNLKDFLEETGLFEYCQGHQGAFGIEIHKDNISKVIELTNEQLKDIDFTEYYEVDFIIEADDLDISFIKAMNELKDLYGQGISESLVYIKNININKKDINLMGKNSDTIKFTYNDEIVFIKFKANENDEIIKWLNDWENDDDFIVIDVIGKAGLNSFNGILTPQIMMENYEIERV